MKRIVTSIYILLLLVTVAAAQPVFVKEIPRLSSNFTEVGSTLFFTSGDTLWKSNGTMAGTVIVKTGLADPGNMFELNGLLYFLNRKINSGPGEDVWTELWVSNGTSAGTLLLRASEEGGLVLAPSIAGTLYFTVNTASQGRELWKTNGTIAGTQLVRDIRSGPESGITNTFFQVLNNNIYFIANNGVNGEELWRSNGSAAGTVMVKDIYPGSASAAFVSFASSAVANNYLFFVANDGIHGPELWRTNGSEASTIMLKDINPSSSPTFFEQSGNSFTEYFPPSNLTTVGNIVYFIPKESFEDQEYVHLWKSDGTSGGTVEVKEVATENINMAGQINGKLVFIGINGASQEVWTSNGTASGTVKIKGNFVGGDNYYGAFIPVNNFLVFTENAQGYNYHLWKTDGTAAGTTLIRKMNSAPRDFEVVNNFLFYTEHGVETYLESGDGINDLELWQSDLTPEGTFMVKNISNQSFAFSANLEEVNNSLMFSTYASFNFVLPTPPPGLWKYTPDPFVVHELTLVNSETDTDIRPLKMNDTIFTDQQITIRAKKSGPVGSIRFFVNDVLRRTENTSPYALAGDISGDYTEWEKEEGVYKVAAQPFSGPNGSGTAGDLFVRHIRVISPDDTLDTYFTLVNSDTDTDIRSLHDFDVIPYSSSTEITIRANPERPVGSVVFELDGSFFWRENTAPYALRGDTDGDYARWIATYGDHILTTRAYVGSNLTGALLETRTIRFRVVPTMASNISENNITLFPNPASSRISVYSGNADEQISQLVIVSPAGDIYYDGAFTEISESVGVDLAGLDMSPGVYFVKVKSQDNQERIVKLIKN